MSSTFEIVHATVIPTTEDVEVKFRIRLDDPDLEKLLTEGQANLVFRWLCGSTLASGSLEPQVAARHVDGTTWVAWLDQQDIRNSVTIEVRAVAKTAIDGYSLERQNSDYLGQSFTIRPGDILGLAGSFDFEADKLYDPLMPPIGSSFRFVEDSSVKRGIKVSFHNDEQVTVAMSSEMLAGLHALGDHPEAQVALVVLPALVETLTYIRTNEENPAADATDKSWYRTVLSLATKAGDLEGDSSLDLAQRILDFPVDKTLQQRLSTEDDE